ncbi:MAG: hypothetical protein QM652_13705 [Legionella sp.]|uniref:hypothetical protein n=1 Tax=Legionella sp. TaxID=459 RepID=UPI0039E6D7E2
MPQKVLFLLLWCCSFVVAANGTLLKLYRPYGDVIEQAAPVIKKTVQGHCLGQSRLIVREDAWRCEADGTIYDPCFVKTGNKRTEALCPHSPWVGDSVLIKMSSPINNEQNKTLDMSRAYPWGIELTTGERCLAIHLEEFYEQMPIRYRCANHNVLFGYLQRCKNVWSMLEKTPEGVVTVKLTKVWF